MLCASLWPAAGLSLGSLDGASEWCVSGVPGRGHWRPPPQPQWGFCTSAESFPLEGSAGGGRGGTCNVLPSDDSASEEAGSQPEGSMASTPSGCSLSSKRPSLHGAGKRHGLWGQELSTAGSVLTLLQERLPSAPGAPQCPLRDPRAGLVLPWGLCAVNGVLPGQQVGGE